jgi:hypothetical protein
MILIWRKKKACESKKSQAFLTGSYYQLFKASAYAISKVGI